MKPRASRSSRSACQVASTTSSSLLDSGEPSPKQSCTTSLAALSPLEGISNSWSTDGYGSMFVRGCRNRSSARTPPLPNINTSQRGNNHHNTTIMPPENALYPLLTSRASSDACLLDFHHQSHHFLGGSIIYPSKTDHPNSPPPSQQPPTTSSPPPQQQNTQPLSPQPQS